MLKRSPLYLHIFLKPFSEKSFVTEIGTVCNIEMWPELCLFLTFAQGD